MPRKARTFRDFPDSYMQLLESLRDSGGATISLQMPDYREASARRHDLYRFFHALHDAAQDETERDPLAQEMSALARETTISIQGNPVELILRRNAISVAQGTGR